jgi:death-on-curing protein
VTDYLTVADVLAIHEDLIAKYGGASGLRDRGLLEAALFRPQTGYYSDLIAEASALWESLSQNHPLVDGNKRVAFAAMFTFLAINSALLEADGEGTWEFLSGLYERGEFEFVVLERWLRTNTSAAPANPV